jgi:shikimate kinase
MYRLRRDKKRPLLQTDNPRQRLEDLYETRRPIYLELANLIVKTDRRLARKLAIDIISQLPDSLH